MLEALLSTLACISCVAAGWLLGWHCATGHLPWCPSDCPIGDCPRAQKQAPTSQRC